MKKIGVIFITIILSVVLLCCSFYIVGCRFDNENIFVTSYTHNVLDRFNYNVRNNRISATGATYEFQPYQTKEELFDGLKETYTVFREYGNKISLIYNNEIFSIKNVSDKKNTYILYGEYFIYTNGSENYYIPFPTDQIVEATDIIPRIKTERFEIKDFDFEYYSQFYSNYEGITINDNMIVGENFTLLISNNDVLIQKTS